MENLKDLLEKAMELFEKDVNRDPTVSIKAASWSVFIDKIPKKLTKLLLDTNTNIKIEGSVGKGSWARVPWIALMSNDITVTTQKGIYIVYLFSEDRKKIYLSLNQGAKFLRDHKYKMDDINKGIKDKLDGVEFKKIKNLYNFKSKSYSYDTTNIHAIEYDVADIPSDDKLKEDLKFMIKLYTNIINKFFEITKGISDTNDKVDKFYKVILEIDELDNEEAKEIGEKVMKCTVNKNTILYGPPGTGKTYSVKEYKDRLGIIEDDCFQFVTFHQSYGYEDFIEGISIKVEGDIIKYQVKDGIFKSFCKKAENNLDKQYLFIIDEINRGNISKIFGELITLIEPSKRLGKEEELKVTLPYSGECFGVPDNVYILGTMNTADRSIAMMDTALRRRFSFIEKMPEYDKISYEIDRNNIQLSQILKTINNRIEWLYDRDHAIGHAFLMNVTSMEDVKEAFENKIIPLLQEYFYDDYSKIKAILNDKLEIYIGKYESNSKYLDKEFEDLINDYDEDKYTLKMTASTEDFQKFIQNIIVRNE